jgi:bacteriocin biosynthesis cyclodehydratase domain-containing protein
LLLLARVLPRVTAVPALPLLAPWYRVVGDGERLLLEYAQSLVVLEGAAVRTLLPALLPLLDGTRSVDDLVVRLGPPARPAVEAALELLAGHGVVIDGPDAPADVRDAARAAAAGHLLPPALAADRLRSATVGVVGSGPVRLEVVRLLAAAGIGSMRRVGWGSRGRADLAVVAPAADELDRLPAWNRAALASGTPFLLVRPWDGRMAAVGPLVLPGQTCCYECLLLRRGANSGFGADLAEVEAAPLAAAPDPALTALAAAVAAHVSVRWAIGGDRSVPGVLYTVEMHPILRLSEHAVLRVPRCPACSVAERAAPPLPWHAALAA